MLKELLGGVNLKRLGIAILVVFVYIFASDFLIHGMLLGSMYKGIASVWRPDMDKTHTIMMGAQFLIAVGFTILFAKGFQKKGIAEGVRFGAFISILSTGDLIMQYAIYPLTQQVLCSWIVAGIVQNVLGGVVVSLVYKK
jgi:hypothetical protein